MTAREHVKPGESVSVMVRDRHLRYSLSNRAVASNLTLLSTFYGPKYLQEPQDGVTGNQWKIIRDRRDVVFFLSAFCEICVWICKEIKSNIRAKSLSTRIHVREKRFTIYLSISHFAPSSIAGHADWESMGETKRETREMYRTHMRQMKRKRRIGQEEGECGEGKKSKMRAVDVWAYLPPTKTRRTLLQQSRGLFHGFWGQNKKKSLPVAWARNIDARVEVHRANSSEKEGGDYWILEPRIGWWRWRILLLIPQHLSQFRPMLEFKEFTDSSFC